VHDMLGNYLVLLGPSLYCCTVVCSGV